MELQDSEAKLQKEVHSLNFAEKRGQMYKKKMEDGEKEIKELKQQLELQRQQIEALSIDGEKLRALEEHAVLRDSENRETLSQNQQLCLTVRSLEQDWEST